MQKKTKCMVCISTRQNTTNLIPFLQFDLDCLLVLETNFARQEKWASGLVSALVKREKQVHCESLGNGSDLSEMIDIVRDITAESTEICWNLGGGQKMQQVAILQVFQERLEKGVPDWACYADPGTRKIFTIQKQQQLESQEQDISTYVGLDDILSVFHLKKRESNTPLLLWSREKADQLPGLENFRDFSFFWEKEKRHRMMDWVIDENGEKPSVLNDLKHDFGEYFEQVVQYEVAKILQRHGKKHHVTEAWANVRVKDDKGKEIAEWDIVLVTDFGTLVILDAKTGIFTSKDEHARLFNLERATGYYGEFWLIIPYLYEDMIQGGFYSQKGNKGKQYRSIPFQLSTLNSRFFVISGQDKPLYLTKRKKDNHILSRERPEQQNNNNILKLLSLPSLMETLRLGRS